MRINPCVSSGTRLLSMCQPHNSIKFLFHSILLNWIIHSLEFNWMIIQWGQLIQRLLVRVTRDDDVTCGAGRGWFSTVHWWALSRRLANIRPPLLSDCRRSAARLKQSCGATVSWVVLSSNSRIRSNSSALMYLAFSSSEAAGTRGANSRGTGDRETAEKSYGFGFQLAVAFHGVGL